MPFAKFHSSRSFFHRLNHRKIENTDNVHLNPYCLWRYLYSPVARSYKKKDIDKISPRTMFLDLHDMEEARRKRRTLRMTLSEAWRGPRRMRSADSADWPPSPQHVLRDPDDLRPRAPTETRTWPVCWGETRNLSLCAAGWTQANGLGDFL